MNLNKTYFSILLFISSLCYGQVKLFDLSKAGSQRYNRSIYCYGFASTKTNAFFSVYRLDNLLQKKDSFYLELGKTKAEDYLQTYSDTLHDYLNIYIQKKDKSVTILRLNKQFEMLAKVEDVEIARLNNSAMFKNNPLYSRNFVYAVQIQSDSSAKQFYVNKYELKSEVKNFEYDFKWQFPFERKNIHSANIFFASDDFILVYVTVSEGIKAGQWILKLNALDGKLMKATKVNDKGDTDNYMFGDFRFEKQQKSLQLIGQKISGSQLDVKAGKLNISNSPIANIYFMEIDSFGEVKRRQDLKVPVNNIVSGAKNQVNSYILRIRNITKDPIGKIRFEADIYKGSGQSLCFMYSNTIPFNLELQEEQVILEKNTILPNLLIEAYYTSKDKLDENGKLCVETVGDIEKIYSNSPTLPVKLQFKCDDEKNSFWLLTKSSVKKNTINYSVLSPEKKVYLVKPVEELPKSSNPGFIPLSHTSYLLFSQPEETKFQLKLYNW